LIDARGGELMESTAQVKWSRPVLFDRVLVNALVTISREFARAATEEVVSQSQYASNGFKSAGEIEEYIEHNKEADRYDLRTLAGKIKDIETFKWEARLKGDIRVSNLDPEQLLALPNALDQSVVSADFSNDSFQQRLEVNFDNGKYSDGTKATIRSEFRVTRHFQDRLRTQLSSSTRASWFLRSGRILWTVWGTITVALNLLSLWGIFGHTASQSSVAPASAWIPIVLNGGVVLIFLCIPLYLMMMNWWDWLFPIVDFYFGGGVHRSDVKKGTRGLIFVGVIVALIVGIIGNVIASRLAWF
jgi:hypothetical protein